MNKNCVKMREININIEGYNVNGICVGCLNYNRTMFYHPAIEECFGLLANITIPESLAIQVCWECLAYVKNAMKFKNQIIASYDFLMNYSKEHMFLESPSKIALSAYSRLQICNLQEYSKLSLFGEELNRQNLFIDIKEEDEILFNVPIKEEIPSDSHYDDILEPVLDNMSSEDDVQLSKLKRKDKEKTKKKKGKKKKTKNRETVQEVEEIKIEKEEDTKTRSKKLKNLPEDMVQLVTMSIEDMWRIRTEDLNSKEFQKHKYKCNDCVIAFNTEKLMNDHINGKHQPKGDNCQLCDICKSYFLTKDILTTHSKLHQKAYKCNECGFITTLKRVMLKHVTIHDSDLSEYGCNLCGRNFSTRAKLNYHRGVCKQERPQCDCCGKVFANKMTLKCHLKILPQSSNSKPKEKLYIPCKGCDKVFHSRKSYRAHVVIHDGVTYPCPICGKLFQWKRNLSRHTRAHRERDAGDTHECRACGKYFASRDCYNNHMRLSKKHVGEETYQHECNYCHKKFATKWCLTDHIDWDHLKRIKYQCNVCFKAFKTAKIMVAHIHNVHSEKKNEEEGEHLCDICGKSYKTVKRLKGHVWAMHTKRSTSKSFKCKLCPATFTWQTSIYKHMKMMHEPKKPKQPRTLPAVKKEEPYPGAELANRMQYFQQNINTLNIYHLQPLETQNVIIGT